MYHGVLRLGGLRDRQDCATGSSRSFSPAPLRSRPLQALRCHRISLSF